MDLSKLRNVDSSDVPYIVIDDEDGLILDDAQKMEYDKYRNKYKECRRVMPEFDMINNPPVGIPVADVFWPVDIRKKQKKNMKDTALGIAKGFGKYTVGLAGAFMGFGAGKVFEGLGEIGAGMLTAAQKNPELAAELEIQFQKIVDRYKFVYGLASIGYGNGFQANGPVENIQDGLGYSYDAQNGVYREGTWQNDQLVFGVTVFDDAIFYGDYRDNFPSEGILVQDGNVMYCGVFNDDLELECEEGFAINFESKMLWVGPFTGGQMNGMCIAYLASEGAMKKYMYENGKAKSGFSGWMAERQGKKETAQKAKERKKEARKEFFGKFLN